MSLANQPRHHSQELFKIQLLIAVVHLSKSHHIFLGASRNLAATLIYRTLLRLVANNNFSIVLPFVHLLYLRARDDHAVRLGIASAQLSTRLALTRYSS